jgi:hypothetical protein
MEVSHMNEVFGLNEEAWNRWDQYRRSRRKGYKTDFGRSRAQVRLASFGEFQMEAVERCMEKEWIDLYPLPKEQIEAIRKAKGLADAEARQFEAMKIRADKVRFRAPRHGETARDYRIDLESAERRFEDAQYRARVATGPRSFKELMGAKR